MPGLRGFSHNRQVTPRERRNAALLAQAMDLIFSGALELGGDGVITINLAANGGLNDTGGELSVIAGPGIEVGVSGVAADLGAALDFDGTDQIAVQVDGTTIQVNGSNQLETIATGETVHGGRFEYPEAGDEIAIVRLRGNWTVTEIRGHTDTGTVTFNIERRAEGTTNPDDVSGTDVCTADLVADSDGELTTTFDNDGDADDAEWLYLAVTSVASAPTVLWVTIEMEVRNA